MSSERRQGDRRTPASSPASVAAVRSTPTSGSQQQQQQQSQQQQQQQVNTANPPTSPIAQPLSLQELTVRTITMTRDPPDSHHGFGICVKGGKDAGEIRSTFRLPPSPYFVPRERGTFPSGLLNVSSVSSLVDKKPHLCYLSPCVSAPCYVLLIRSARVVWRRIRGMTVNEREEEEASALPAGPVRGSMKICPIARLRIYDPDRFL